MKSNGFLAKEAKITLLVMIKTHMVYRAICVNNKQGWIICNNQAFQYFAFWEQQEWGHNRKLSYSKSSPWFASFRIASFDWQPGFWWHILISLWKCLRLNAESAWDWMQKMLHLNVAFYTVCTKCSTLSLECPFCHMRLHLYLPPPQISSSAGTTENWVFSWIILW